jgi:hypothetical protein
MSANLLAPVFALILWSLVMLVWTMVVRLPALARLKLTTEQSRGVRGCDLDRILPREVNWPAHNFIHLMEQPTLFYAAAIGLALLGAGTPFNVCLAWAYVALRVVHSLWQARVNTIPVRASLFLLYTAVLMALAINGFLTALRA